MAPAAMRVMMSAQSDGSDAAPLTGHGFLLGKGVFTTIDHPDAVTETFALGINNRGQIVGVAGNVPSDAGAPSEEQPSAQQDGIAMGAMGLMGMRPVGAEATR